MTQSGPAQTSHLRHVRQASGRSLRAVARAADIDPAHLSRIERGIARPSIPTLRRILNAVGVADTAALLGLYDKEAA